MLAKLYRAENALPKAQEARTRLKTEFADHYPGIAYLARLALITAGVLAVHNQSWVSIVPLGLTIIVSQLGRLIWETRYVSASLAFPGLKPTKKGS